MLLPAQRRKIKQLAAETAAALEVLGPRGWMAIELNHSAVTQAVEQTRAGRGESADDLLAAQVDDGFIRRIVSRVLRLGGNQDPEMARLITERGRLLELARHHHAQEGFEASVPLVLAQVEGITADASDGGMFFSAHPARQANVVDPLQLVAIEAGLDALRKVYGARVNQTQTVGFPARHGVLHGRELAYDTWVASAKCWTLLGGIVAWAQPLLTERSRAALEQRERLTAGSQDVDGVGRRVDAREFKATKEALGYLESMAWGRHRNTGKFHPDLVAFVRGVDRFGLDDPHSITARTDDERWWAWRTTISGWVLGVGLKPDGNSMRQYRFAGDHHPEELFDGEDLRAGWKPYEDPPPDWTLGPWPVNVAGRCRCGYCPGEPY